MSAWYINKREISPQAGGKLFWQSGAPFCFLESDQNKAIANEQWTLYKHTVGCEKLQHFLLTHGGEPVFQVQGFVKQTACVEKLFKRQSAHLVPFCQLIQRWIVKPDIPGLISDCIVIQPLLCLLTGGAFGVTNQLQHHIELV